MDMQTGGASATAQGREETSNMVAGAWNMLFGLVLVVAGASGNYSFPFTNSPELVLVAGAAMMAWGGSQIWRSRKQG